LVDICFISGLKIKIIQSINNKEWRNQSIHYFSSTWTLVQYYLWSPYDRKEQGDTEAQKRLNCPSSLCSPISWWKVSWWWW